MHKKITIVGGGTAGFTTALILKTRFPKFEIKVIRSKNIGIIGVGEGTTEHWHHFMQMVGINAKELVQRADATLKYGVMFEGWTDQPYMHSVPDQINELKIGQYPAGYGYMIANEYSIKDFNLKNAWDKQVVNSEQPYQYHFNTHKLNDFLEEVSISRGISIIDDEIETVNIENNNIVELVGNQIYTSDIFIDCTGFKKLLISKLGAKWQSYSKWLSMNEAIAFPTEDTDEYNPYTLAKALSAGWMWRIPVWGRWGNGYVFNSKYITVEEAKKEVEKELGVEVNIAKHIKFDPGCLDQSWIGNCIAIGLSSNFVEPLEATSIGSTINQVFLLMHYLPNYNKHSIDLYNKNVNLILENIRDFVIIHYLSNKNDSNFWKDLKKTELPLSLKNKLERWKTNLPIRDDVVTTPYVLFHEQNWINVLYGIDWFDECVKDEYNILNEDYKLYIENKVKDFVSYKFLGTSHKQFLKSVRDT